MTERTDHSDNPELPSYGAEDFTDEPKAPVTVVDEPVEEVVAEGDEPPPESAGQRRKRRKRSARRNTVEWIIVLVGAVAVALIIKTFLIQAFYIPSTSMEPTLHEGDRVLVNKLSYDLHDVNRGDVVVFKRPEQGQTVETCDGKQLNIPAQPSGPGAINDLIKRVIALPGETVEQRDGRIYVNGKLLEESYVPAGESPAAWAIGAQCIRVPSDRVWVMGDNRDNSEASNAFGPIEESSIVGRAFVRVWPVDDISGL